jgi:acyl-CoA thioesterase FadM
MARITIELPEKFPVSTELPLLSIHINRGGHLDNAMLLTLASEGRTRFFQFYGCSDVDTEGLVAFTGDVAVQYISEGRYGEVMVIDMAARDLNKYGFDLVFRFSEKTSGREIARGKYGLVFYDPRAKKVAPMPGSFRNLIEA